MVVNKNPDMTLNSRVDILLASRNFYPTYAGGAMRFQRYAPGFRERGIDMRVFAAAPAINEDSSITGLKAGSLLPLAYHEGIQIQRVQLPRKNTRREEMRFASRLVGYCRTNPPDLIHSLGLPVWWLPWWFSYHRLNIPIIYTQTLASDLSPKPLKRFFQKLSWRLPIQMLTECVVVSSASVRNVLRSTGVTKRIEVIPNGVDTRRFKPITSLEEKQALRKQLGLPLECELILWVGILIERKGVDTLIAAWRLIAQKRPRAYLVLVGPTAQNLQGEEHAAGFQSTIEKSIADSGAADRILFTGRVNNIELYYQSADLLIFPSRREGMGNVVLEAFSCGLATILTQFVGFPFEEFGAQNENYILTERTPEALAQAANDLLDDPVQRERVGRQSRKWVEMQLGVEKSLDKYADLYRELAAYSRKNKDSR